MAIFRASVSPRPLQGILTISDSGDTAQVDSPGRPEVPKSSSGFPRGRSCGTAVGLDCLQGRREPGRTVVKFPGPELARLWLRPSSGTAVLQYRSAGPGTCWDGAERVPGPLRPATSCCRPVPDALQLGPRASRLLMKLLTVGPRPEKQRQQRQQKLQRLEACNPEPAHGSQGQVCRWAWGLQPAGRKPPRPWREVPKSAHPQQ